MPLPDGEPLLANAIQYLIHGDERDAALLLLSCEAECGYSEDGFCVYLTGPREVYQALGYTPPMNTSGLYIDEMRVQEVWESDNRLNNQVKEAFKAVTPNGLDFTGFSVRVKYADIQPGWREELLEIAHGRRVHNQGVDIPGREIIEWGNLRFRSQTEVRIARALDTVGVLFLPNCLARLNKDNARTTKEADFLVCQNGKWGILEADGPFHPRAASDHDRDRLFRQHGIKVIERFTAEDCYEDAPGVVRKFLTLLQQNG